MSVPGEVISTEPSDWQIWGEEIVPTSIHDRLTLAPVTSTINFDRHFQALVSEWKNDTGHLSQLSQRITHPAYKRIITMGRSVLPLILAELRDAPDHWFHALSFLSDENPIPATFRGTVAEAAELWLSWGRERNLLSDAA